MYLIDIMTSILQEGESLSQEVIEIILSNLVEPNKVRMYVFVCRVLLIYVHVTMTGLISTMYTMHTYMYFFFSLLARSDTCILVYVSRYMCTVHVRTVSLPNLRTCTS